MAYSEMRRSLYAGTSIRSTGTQIRPTQTRLSVMTVRRYRAAPTASYGAHAIALVATSRTLIAYGLPEWPPSARAIIIGTSIAAGARTPSRRCSAPLANHMMLQGILREVNEWLRIRPAGGEDADPIARLFLASKATLTFLPNIHSDEETFCFIANIVLRDQEVQVAETNGEIIGFLAMREDMVEHLYVRPDLLRRGIGSALLQRAKERMPLGFRLWVFQENVPARRFYECHGLRLVEETDGSRNEERTPDALYEWRPTDS